MNLLKLYLSITLLFAVAFAQTEVLEESAKDQQLVEQEITQNINPYDISPIEKLVSSDNYNMKEGLKVSLIEKAIKVITDGLVNEIKVPINEVAYNTQLSFYKSKIKINSKEDNFIAVQRDELKRQKLVNEHHYYELLRNIIKGLNTYKDKKYYLELIDAEIKRLKAIEFQNYRATYKRLEANTDVVSMAFKQAYDDVRLQIKAQEVIYHYLVTKIKEYRSSLIFDDLSFDYVVDLLNKLPVLAYLTEVIEYYVKVSMGEIIVAFTLLFIFIMIYKYVIPLFNKQFHYYLIKRYAKKGERAYEYLDDSISFPFILFFFVFTLQMMLFVMIESPYNLEKISPWFNTAYIAILSYGIYTLLKNAIVYFSEQLFVKYPNVRKEMIDFILRIGKLTVFLFVLLFLFMQLGFDIKAIVASLGIGGIAVALAAKDTLTNFFGSLSIIMDNSFSQGDWIQTSDVEGTVIDIRMRTTRIRTFQNAMITVPNSELANASIINWSKRKIGRRIKMSLGITYASKMSDIKKLAEDIKEMLEDHPGIATQNVQFEDKEKQLNLLQKEDLLGIKRTLLVFIDEYDASSINILVYCFSRSPVWEEWLEVKEDVMVKISVLVEKNNCAFAFPTQSIYIENNKEDELKTFDKNQTKT